MPRGIKGSGPGAPQPVAFEAPAAVHIEMDERTPLGSLDVDSLSGDALKRYARRAGVGQRDVDGLSEDRLRHNTKLTIAYHFELLTEG
ncbi:MAG: hypothetical protein H0W48_00040 [Methylibium sp.]|nr:hypothetical protein [Methylibium sp.]